MSWQLINGTLLNHLAKVKDGHGLCAQHLQEASEGAVTSPQ